MRLLRRSTVRAALAVAALVLGAPEAARACSCVRTDAASARDAATAVFEAVLLRHEASGDGAVATFRVERVWRGRPGSTVTVRTPGLGSMCPPHFEVGERYIVYAGGPPDRLEVRQCARYAAGRQLAEERRALGPPRERHAR